MTRLGQMIFDDGIKEGMEKGIEKGMEKGLEMGSETKLIRQVCRKLVKGKEISVIAEELEEDPEIIGKICQVAAEFAPDYDCECIYQKLKA